MNTLPTVEAESSTKVVINQQNSNEQSSSFNEHITVEDVELRLYLFRIRQFLRFLNHVIFPATIFIFVVFGFHVVLSCMHSPIKYLYQGSLLFFVYLFLWAIFIAETAPQELVIRLISVEFM